MGSTSPSSRRCPFVRLGRKRRRRESARPRTPAVAAVGQGGVKDPAGLTHEPLGGPGVVLVEVGDDSVEQIWGDGADRAELVDGGWGEDGARDAVTQFPQLGDDLSVRTGTGCRSLMLKTTERALTRHSSSDHAAIPGFSNARRASGSVSAAETPA